MSFTTLQWSVQSKSYPSILLTPCSVSDLSRNRIASDSNDIAGKISGKMDDYCILSIIAPVYGIAR